MNGVCSIASDLAMPTVNYLANELRLVGNTQECTILTTNKHEMNMFMIFDFILLQLGTISLNANRIAWYFFTVYLILISRFFGQKIQSYRMISYLILYIILLLYWWWSFVVSRYGETYPFEFYE